MKKAKLTLLFLGLLSCAEVPTPSETQDIGDAISMTIREDGQFNVICKDGDHEVASVDDIRNGKICGGALGLDNGSSECKYAKLLLGVVKSLPEFSDQVNDAKELNLAACAENRPNRYSNGNRVLGQYGYWYYPNGNRALGQYGYWYYPNGNRALGQYGYWNYPNGYRALGQYGYWNYPNGNRALGQYGYWYYPNGNRTSTSGDTVCERMTNLMKTTLDESLLGQMRAAKIVMCRQL